MCFMYFTSTVALLLMHKRRTHFDGEKFLKEGTWSQNLRMPFVISMMTIGVHCLVFHSLLCKR